MTTETLRLQRTALLERAHAIGLSPEAVVAGRDRSAYERFAKPVADRVAALLLLLLLLPVLATVAVVVLVTLGHPILYKQERVGFEGRRFQMLKFRTMRQDRRAGRGDGYDGPDRRRRHKTPEDPRHTATGRFLRRFSLDELPQLWHVLVGDLSLVGPRPELASVVESYEAWQHQRHLVKPGLTGLWQVTERDEHGYMHLHVDTDLRYIRELSPALDLRIAVATIPAIFGVTSQL